MKNGANRIHIQKGEDNKQHYSPPEIDGKACLPVRQSDCVYLRVQTKGLPIKADIVLYFGGLKVHEETRQFFTDQREEFLVVERKYATVGNSTLCTGLV